MVTKTSPEGNSIDQNLLERYAATSKLSERSRLLVEKFINDQHYSWENLPWQEQFKPLIIQYFWQLPWMKYVNPGMSHLSGMMEIPKAEINTHLPKKYLPQTELFPANISQKSLKQSFEAHKFSFPVICKPNIGERSSGVNFVQNETELLKYLHTSSDDFLVQSFCSAKKEFGVSVQRYQKNPRIFRITSFVEKITPTVTGDGQHTIAQLVEALKISATQRQKIKQNASPTELKEVLPAGQVRPIVRTASISLGTVIKNLNDKINPQLEHSLSQVLTDYAGFNVGRFDLKADSVEAIINGDFTIIELNGINGIPMHVYCPELSVETRYEILDQYFSDLFSWAEKNSPEHRWEIKDLLEIVRFFYRTIQRQSQTSSKENPVKSHRKYLRKFALKAEFYRLGQKIKRIFR